MPVISKQGKMLAKELKARGLWHKTQTTVAGKDGFKHIADLLVKSRKGRKIVIEVDAEKNPAHAKIDARLRNHGFVVVRIQANNVTDEKFARALAKNLSKKHNLVTLAENNKRVRGELDKIMSLYHGRTAKEKAEKDRKKAARASAAETIHKIHTGTLTQRELKAITPKAPKAKARKKR